MQSKLFLSVTLLSVLFTCAIASAQVEEITLSTYYPAPYGEYEEMAAEKLFADKVIIGNMDVDGDGIDSTPADIAAMGVGSLLIENKLGIGTAWPDQFVKLHVMGSDVGGTNLTDDANDPNRRPTIQIEGPYPNLIIKSQGNPSHSSTIGLWAFDGVDTRQWNMGVGQNGLFSMGYCTNQWNPHCGLNNHVTNSVLAMTPSGNVGIGTAGPAFRLHVVGNEAYFHGNNAWGVSLMVHNDSGGNTWRWVTGGATGDGNSPAGGMAIHRDGAFSPLQIKNDGTVFMNVGNVGIGTTNPDEKLDVDGNIRTTGGIKYGDLQDYRMVYRDDFQTTASGWSYTGRSTFAGATILGGYNLTSNTSFYKDYDLTDFPHTEVMVRATYYAIDTWDGEWGYIRADGRCIWNRHFWYQEGGRTNLGGWTYADGIYFAEGRTSHTANTVRVRVGSTLNQGPADESFGVDNVEVWVR